MSRDYIKKPVRSAAILTNSYVAGTVLEETHFYNQLVVLVDFTIGSLTTAELKVEFSTDNSTFYQQVGTAYSTGTTTVAVNEYSLGATGKFEIPMPIKARYIKISVIGTGTVTNSTVTVDAILGNSN